MPQSSDPPKADRYNYQLSEGETIEGQVLRLPQPQALQGTFLFLDVNGEVFAIKATANAGRAVLERELAKVSVGDRIRVVYFGKRSTVDGNRSYHHYAAEAVTARGER